MKSFNKIRFFYTSLKILCRFWISNHAMDISGLGRPDLVRIEDRLKNFIATLHHLLVLMRMRDPIHYQSHKPANKKLKVLLLKMHDTMVC